MRKRMLLIAGLYLGSTGFAMAEVEVAHIYFGFGHHFSFLGTPIRVNDEGGSPAPGERNASVLKCMPFGLSHFFGLGYGFKNVETITVGGESVFSWAKSLNPSGLTHFSLQVRAFGRYTPSEEFSVLGFAGVKGNLARSKWKMPGGVYPMFGVRIEALVFYLEYGVALKENFSNIYTHDLGIGFAARI